MLFNEHLLFLHVPKTGGTSVTGFLMRHLPGRIAISEPFGLLSSPEVVPLAVRAQLQLRHWRRRAGLLRHRRVRLVPGLRHETLAEARDLLERQGRTLGGFERVLAVIRNPYDLEVSRYHFFRRGHHGIPGLVREDAERLALSGDFAAFAREAAYHGKLPGRIEDWFELDGQSPPNLRILRFETLDADLRRAIAPFCTPAAALPKLNASVHADYRTYLTSESEAAIYDKYRWLFERGFYARERV